MADCREIIVSEDYADFIVNFTGEDALAREKFGVECFQRISSYYGVVYRPLNAISTLSLRNYSYNSIPALYGLMERDLVVRRKDLDLALDESGILKLQNQPSLRLRGQGCIMSFIDTGIDIFDEEFRFSNGDTRILRLWDMTDNTGRPPEGILYGSEYNSEDINRILRANDRQEEATVEESVTGRNVIDVININRDNLDGDDKDKNSPGQDNIGHGNILAKIAAGNRGAVPEANIVVVKLKQAKNYLKDYFFVPDNVPAFQENDIMLAVNYVRNIALSLDMPVSLCMTIGTNQRSHDGASALSYILDRFASGVGTVVCLSTGDEGNKQLHGTNASKILEATGKLANTESLSDSRDYSLVEIRVDERQKGLFINIWGSKPGIISVGLVSPTGEVIERVVPRIGKSEIYNLIFDGTTVTIEYDLVEADSSDELIIVRLENPTAGIWSLRIYDSLEKYNVYLPVSQFVYPNTYILEPSADITIVDPAVASNVITTSLYDARNRALYIANGRGFGRDGSIKPDISSALSCAITAGAACQFLNWGIVEGRDRELRASDIKGYFIRGAIRDNDIVYPSRQWGYGRLDVYNSFEVIRG